MAQKEASNTHALTEKFPNWEVHESIIDNFTTSKQQCKHDRRP